MHSYFQGDLSQHLARASAGDGPRHAADVRVRADRIDRAVQAAVASARALAAARPLYREPSQLVDYRLATRFEPQARAAMRSATAAALARMQSADRRAALLLLAALLVGTLASVLIVRGILGPIRKLLAGTHAVASGNYRGLEDVSGRDELAALGAAFNAMARTSRNPRRRYRLQRRGDRREPALRAARPARTAACAGRHARHRHRARHGSAHLHHGAMRR